MIENNETEFRSSQLEDAPSKSLEVSQDRGVVARIHKMDSDPIVKEVRFDDLKNAYTNVLEAAGEDVTREGLLKTPERAAKALEFFMSGYRADINGKLFTK